MLSSDDCLKPQFRFLQKTVSQDDELLGRIPPDSDKLLENLPWLNIMSELAFTAAIAEFKVCIAVKTEINNWDFLIFFSLNSSYLTIFQKKMAILLLKFL